MGLGDQVWIEFSFEVAARCSNRSNVDVACPSYLVRDRGHALVHCSGPVALVACWGPDSGAPKESESSEPQGRGERKAKHAGKTEVQR